MTILRKKLDFGKTLCGEMATILLLVLVIDRIVKELVDVFGWRRRDQGGNDRGYESRKEAGDDFIDACLGAVSQV